MEPAQEGGGAASPEPLGKLAPKPLPFQLQEALPVLVVEGVSDGMSVTRRRKYPHPFKVP